jgi:hypothetical protein
MMKTGIAFFALMALLLCPLALSDLIAAPPGNWTSNTTAVNISRLSYSVNVAAPDNSLPLLLGVATLVAVGSVSFILLTKIRRKK